MGRGFCCGYRIGHFAGSIGYRYLFGITRCLASVRERQNQSKTKFGRRVGQPLFSNAGGLKGFSKGAKWP